MPSHTDTPVQTRLTSQLQFSGEVSCLTQGRSSRTRSTVVPTWAHCCRHVCPWVWECLLSFYSNVCHYVTLKKTPIYSTLLFVSAQLKFKYQNFSSHCIFLLSLFKNLSLLYPTWSTIKHRDKLSANCTYPISDLSNVVLFFFFLQFTCLSIFNWIKRWEQHNEDIAPNVSWS